MPKNERGDKCQGSTLQIQGHVGYLRFCRRGDVSPSSLGDAAFEELPRSQPNAGDIVVIAKNALADSSPYKAVVLMTVDQAAAIRLGLRQPTVTAEKRPIGVDVRKNIFSYADRCAKQGCISKDAAAHLKSWAEGSLHVKRKPIKYRFLDSRQPDNFATIHPNVVGLPWEPPGRARNISFLDRNTDDDDHDGDDGDEHTDDEENGPVDALE